MGRKPPLVVVWEITRRCNGGCSYCGSSAGKPYPKELRTEEALDLIRQLDELGVKLVTLIGGEVFLRSDWPQLTAEIKKRGMEFFIVTNGSLLTEETLGLLSSARPANVSVSLDGTASLHDELRPGAPYARVLSALRILSKNGFCTSIITTVQKKNMNFRSLEHLLKLKKRLGLFSWRVQIALPEGRMTQEMTLSQEDCYRLSAWIARKNKKKQEITVGNNIGYCSSLEPFIRGPWNSCPAGIFNLGITSDGRLKGCLALPDGFSEANIRERNLKDVWNDEKSFAYNRAFAPNMLEGSCRGCKNAERCRGGCKASNACFGNIMESHYCNYRFELSRNA
jgi:radical SAM protein with 4Fe4S-binding SPASM domain